MKNLIQGTSSPPAHLLYALRADMSFEPAAEGLHMSQERANAV